MDASVMWKALGNGDVVLVALVAAGLGALGGLAHHLATPPPDGGAPKPPAWWKEMIVGAVAAAAILFVAKPETPIALISGSLVAGYGGIAIMTALVARAEAMAARQRAREARADLRRALDTLESADPEGAAATARELRAKYP
jgi:hypothetical protein